jgi:hypothetical protein
VEQAIAAGHRLPRWGWPTLRHYNGCTGEERIAGWKKVRIAEAFGLLRRDGTCSVCHRVAAEQFHAESYLRPMVVRQVCRSCHLRIHRRFSDPAGWHSFLSQRARPGGWAVSLRTIELDRQEAERIAAASDIFAALAAN